MRKVKIAFLVLFLAGITASVVYAVDSALTERVNLASKAFQELMDSPDAKVPASLLNKSQAIVIFPRTINVAWGIGGQYGKGVAMKHDTKTGRWSSPAFYTLGGLTLGPQIGGQAVDIVLVVVNEKGLESLLKSKCTLGADAGVAVGPAGRNATANTDLSLTSEIYSYSRAKGLYIGLSLKGAMVAPDDDANRSYYGGDTTARKIFESMSGARTAEDRKLLGLLGKYSGDFQKGLIIVGIVLVALAGFFFYKRKNKK